MTNSTIPARPLRTLVVGAGRRVQNNFLPVLHCLADAYDIVGLHSRTFMRVKTVAEQWQVPAIREIADLDPSSIDVVAISVPTSQNAAVLKQFMTHAESLSIVIDTPVAWTPQELLSTLSLLRRFRRVVVTEDYMNFPTFSLLREAVQAGVIGTLKGITLYNIGFYYHGLALIRSFAGFCPAVRTWQKRAGSFSNIVGYDLKGGVRGIVVGPYCGHSAGGITIEGTDGILTDFCGDTLYGNVNKRPIYTLLTHSANERMCGLSIDGLDLTYARDLPLIGMMTKMQFSDKSNLNLLRGCGLATVFRSLYEPQDINRTYGLANAYYDSFISRLASRGILPVDPLTWIGTNSIKALTSLVTMFRN